MYATIQVQLWDLVAPLVWIFVNCIRKIFSDIFEIEI